MTAKDHKILAEALHSAYEGAFNPGYIAGINLATNAIADALRTDNPRFDEGTFYAAVRGEA